jgi:uncharacterized protein
LSAQVGEQPRFLGIDEGPFTFDQDKAVVAGVLTRGPHTVEAVLVDRVQVDGWDATDLVIRSARKLPGNGCDRILIDGITLGGINLVDLQQVATTLQVPALAIARRPPSPHGLETAARRASASDRRIKMLPQEPPMEVRLADHTLWVQAHQPKGPIQDPAHIAALLQGAMSESRTPEPLRLAHHIATAVVRGISGTAP